MTSPKECPPDLDLRNLVAGKVADGQAREIIGHLDECSDCQRRLTQHDGTDDLFSSLTCLEHRPEESPPLQNTLKRLKQLPTVNALGNQEETVGIPRGLTDELAPIKNDGFQILGVLGKGGMGVVYKAREVSLDRIVAIKVLSPSLARDDTTKERFLREARLAASVVHPNVITIHAISELGPCPYLVMEYVEGVSLQQQLDCGGEISIENVVRIGRQITAALIAAHRKGVIHRDVKPSNIMLNASTKRVLLGDFGLARAVEGSNLTRSGIILGTPAYMAPEVLSPEEEVDHRSDLFAVGAVLYAMCTGDSPFQSDTLLATLHRVSAWQPSVLKEIAPKVPDWLSDVVMRLLAKQPCDRFPSAEAVHEVLKNGSVATTVLSSDDRSTQVGARPSSSPATAFSIQTQEKRPSSQTTRRKSPPLFWGGAAILTCAAIVGTVGIVWRIIDRSAVEPATATSDTENPTSDLIVSQRDLPRAQVKPDTHGAPASDDPDTVGSGTERPFLCTDENGGVVASYAALDEAIEHIPSRGLLRIASNETLDVESILIQNAIQMEAQQGYTPTLRLTESNDQDAMFFVEGTLKLKGLKLRLPRQSSDLTSSLISIQENGTLDAIDCELVIEDEGYCVIDETDRRITLLQCRLHSPQSSALALFAAGETQLTDCWITGESAFLVACAPSHQLKLDRTRIVSGFGFVVDEDDDNDEDVFIPWTLQARKCTFLTFDGWLADEDGEGFQIWNWWEEVVRWRGSGNVFSGKSLLFNDMDASDIDDVNEFLESDSSRQITNPFLGELHQIELLIHRPEVPKIRERTQVGE